jgi:thermitase
MLKRIVSGIILTLLIIGMITSVFHIQPCRVEPKAWAVDDDGSTSAHETQEATNNANPGYTYSPSLVKDWLMRADGSDLANGLTVRAMDDFRASLSPSYRWSSLSNEIERSELAYVNGDSAELVIGLDVTRSSSYPELVNMIVSNCGRLVSTVSMAGNISAVVADIPHVAVSTFVSEVKVGGLSRYIEPNMSFEVDFVPNDPDWPTQWGPRIIQADYAWNTTRGNGSVLVAVIDTGIDWHHPDLAANYVPLGYDWVNNDTDPVDDNGHGTHCAGIIAAGLNNSIGIAGLAQVRIMAEKAFNKIGIGDEVNLAKAIVHAVDQGAKILSCSWGGHGESALMHYAVRYAYDHGVLIISAAGNDITECKSYPAAYEEVVAVSATNENDSSADFTNYGDWIEVAAPGVNVYSTWLNDTYISLSGTSMSTPHVAAVAALLWGQFPDITRNQVRAQLRYTADDLGDPGFDIYYGYGRVNARRAVEQALPEHDMALLSWNAPCILKPFDTAAINGTLLNFGTNDESDVTVQLLVNGSVAYTESINHLASGASTTVSYAWSPTTEGKYNVTLCVSPVDDETLTQNNFLSEYVIVRSSKTVMVPNDFPRIQKAVDEVSPGYTIQVAPGTYHEHLMIDKSIALIGENRNTTVIDGNEIGSVITVAQDNVSVSGFTIQDSGRYDDYGIGIYGSNESICGNTVTSSRYGIGVWYTTNSTIVGNIISNSVEGMYLEGSSGNLLRNNHMIENTYNFDIVNTELEQPQPMRYYINDIDTSNTVDGKPICYWVNQKDKTVPPDAGYVAAVNSTRITVKNVNLANNGQGVFFLNVTDSAITNSRVSNSFEGFYLQESSSNRINGNTAVGNLVDVWLYPYCNANIIDDNIASEGMVGIALSESSNNIVRDNMVLENKFSIGIGIALESPSNDNIIICNVIRSNKIGVSISFSPCNNNTLYHNNFINNTLQASITDERASNVWDNGYPSGGNYWSDYQETYSDAGELDDSGIWNESSVIDENNKDNYPLMRPWRLIPGDANLDLKVDMQDLVLVALAYGSEPGSSNWNPLTDIAPPYRSVGLADLVTVACYYGKTYP